MATLISVISSEYCLPNSIKLTIDADKGVTYINNEVIFRADEPSFTLHSRRVLRDVSGDPVLTLYMKRMTMHGRWQVFKHGSTDSDNLLFSVKRPSLWKPHKKNIDLDVFLAKNTEEHVWDFKVNAAGKRSCDICAQGSSTILAKMTNNKGAFEVAVEPNVDYAFIVALLMIVDEINDSDNAGKGGGGKLLQGLSMVGTTIGVAASGATLVNEIRDPKAEGADADANDTTGAADEGADDDANDTTGAADEGADDDANDTTGAADEGADDDANDTTGRE